MSTTKSRERFRADVLWNFASIAILGTSGIALNTLITNVDGDAALGVFNQVWASYIFFSQLAVGGIDLSVLRAVSAHNQDRAKCFEIAASALIPTLALAALSTLAFWGSRHALADWLESPEVAEGMSAAAPGLFFFALNKVLFGVQNGLQRMRAYAVLQSVRYLGLVGGFFVAHALELGPARLAFLLSFSEGLLFLLLSVEVATQLRWHRAGGWLRQAREHLVYGVRSCMSGVLMEVNSRVDILLLGRWYGNDVVGLYSYAAMIVEGVFQLLVKLQNNYNPLIAQHLASGKIAELEALVRRGKRLTWLLMLGVGAVAVVGYPFAVDVLTTSPEMPRSWAPFCALIAGVVLSAGFMPFQQTLLMGNRPGWHTLLMLTMVLANVIGNVLLIPHLEMVGSAVATSLAMVASCVLLVVLSKRLLGVRLYGVR